VGTVGAVEPQRHVLAFNRPPIAGQSPRLDKLDDVARVPFVNRQLYLVSPPSR
jgi:hypothetical protein